MSAALDAVFAPPGASAPAPARASAPAPASAAAADAEVRELRQMFQAPPRRPWQKASQRPRGYHAAMKAYKASIPQTERRSPSPPQERRMPTMYTATHVRNMLNEFGDMVAVSYDIKLPATFNEDTAAGIEQNNRVTREHLRPTVKVAQMGVSGYMGHVPQAGTYDAAREHFIRVRHRCGPLDGIAGSPRHRPPCSHAPCACARAATASGAQPGALPEEDAVARLQRPPAAYQVVDRDVWHVEVGAKGGDRPLAAGGVAARDASPRHRVQLAGDLGREALR